MHRVRRTRRTRNQHAAGVWGAGVATIAIFLPGFLLVALALIRFKVNTTWLVASGAILGALVKTAQ
jgi:hypothetical protein